jgi:hypothetical protein
MCILDSITFGLFPSVNLMEKMGKYSVFFLTHTIVHGERGSTVVRVLR